MKRNVKTKVKLNHGNVCALSNSVVFRKDVRPENHKEVWLTLEYDCDNETATLGKCIYKPSDGHWGAFETFTGFVVAKFEMAWWFYAGEYVLATGSDTKLAGNSDGAVCFETKRQALVALAILNLKEV